MFLDRWTLTLLIAVQLGRLLHSPAVLISVLTLLAIVRIHLALQPSRLFVLVRHGAVHDRIERERLDTPYAA